MSELARKHCTPCRDGMAALTPNETVKLAAGLDGWTICDGPRLTRKWRFKDFSAALAFVNRIGAIADAEDHHPDIALGWGRVEVELWTHAANGLTENDFIIAAKIDEAHAGA